MSVSVGKRVTVSAAMPDGRVDVSGYVLDGTGERFAVTHPVDGKGRAWRVTHIASGLRLPGDGFTSRAAAARAVAVWLSLVPDACDIADRIGAGVGAGPDAQRVADGWRAAIGEGPSVSTLDPYAGIRAEIRERFGSWEDATRRVLADIGALDAGWQYSGDALRCPCGYLVEDDGACPSGHVSPLRAAGLV